MINYILDTNILLETNGINHFMGKGVVHIPLVCIGELDNIKTNSKDSELKYYSRKTVRFIEDNLDKLNILKTDDTCLDKSMTSYEVIDDLILSTAMALPTENKILVSNDLNVRLKATGMGLASEKYTGADDLNEYTGHKEIIVDDCIIDDIYKYRCVILDFDALENQCVTFISSSNNKKQAMTLFKEGRFKLCNNINVYGTVGKNRQQKYLMNLLEDDSIPLIAISADAGTGKSYLSTIMALHKVLEKRSFKKIVYVKPLEAMGGKDIGFLPENKEAKLLGGYAGTIENILENIFAEREMPYKKQSYAMDLIEQGVLQVEAPTFMRGMSYKDSILIIDEASNLSKADIKNLVSRIGENSRIFLLGDTEQIDNRVLSKWDNGLSHVIDKMKGQKLFATVKLDRSIRSDLSQLSVDLL